MGRGCVFGRGRTDGGCDGGGVLDWGIDAMGLDGEVGVVLRWVWDWDFWWFATAKVE